MKIKKISGIKIENEYMVFIINENVVLSMLEYDRYIIHKHCEDNQKTIEELLQTPTDQENLILIEETKKAWEKWIYERKKSLGKEIIKFIELTLESMTVSLDTAIKNLKAFSEIKTCLDAGYLELALKLIENLEANNRQGFVGTSFENNLEVPESIKTSINNFILKCNRIKKELQQLQ